MHEERNRGWYFPKALLKLYNDRTLNAEDMMLLGKINALVPCFASNAYLAKWWGKDSRHVSRTIKRFIDLGLIRSEVKVKAYGTHRTLFTTFQGDDLVREGWTKMSRGVDKNVHPGRTKMSSKYCSYTSYNSKEISKNPLRCAKAHSQAGVNGLIFKESNTPLTKAAKLCQTFNEWRIKNRLHIGRSKPNKVKWERAANDLIERLEGNIPRIREVLSWYFENFKDPYTPNVLSMSSFCDKFDSIEKAMMREKKSTPQTRITAVYSKEEWDQMDGEIIARVEEE